METKNMSVPHSVIQASYGDEVEKHPGTTGEAPVKEKKGMVSTFEWLASVASTDFLVQRWGLSNSS
jgi:hypothetical protein